MNLDGTAITDAAVDSLVQIKSLRELSLEQTQITAAGYARLQEALPECDITWTPAADPWTPDYTRDRAAAEWVLGVGGTVRLTVSR